MDPSRRFVTLVLGVGVVVLLGAIVLGESMGDRVMVQAVDSGVTNASVIVTPLPVGASTAPYGPDWQSSQTLSAASDPNFPDPRIPPKPLPTPLSPATAKPKPKWTPNPNIPIWDQTALPSPTSSP
ncbi:MAG TPA: hypothetical protein VNF68_07380 [Candidatus Baltobacteraceae bacterium]|nr:hypothetical protein [Candidatus Baltobacteraceae bacterium]